MRTNDFAYSAYNVDNHGDLLNNKGVHFSGPESLLNKPRNICPDIIVVLRDLVTKMKTEDVRVLVAHIPYLVNDTPSLGWQKEEEDFLRDVKSTGAELLDHREELFFPRAYFFDGTAHLNEVGRHERTRTLIADLRKLGIGRFLSERGE